MLNGDDLLVHEARGTPFHINEQWAVVYSIAFQMIFLVLDRCIERIADSLTKYIPADKKRQLNFIIYGAIK